MHHIKRSNKMKKFNNEWWDTSDVIIQLCRNGKNLNQGLNIFEAEKILKAAQSAKDEKKSYVDLEDHPYDLLKKDVSELNFQQIGIAGVVIAEDVRNIVEAKSEKPEDYDAEFVPVKPE